jgi:hypothetical protein
LIWKKGFLLAKTDGMVGAREDGNYIRFVVGSGIYSFNTKNPEEK